ncbi:hypothetical protein [Mycoplasmopsis synoviae]|uniref:hypothetical protein n=1 Tax=Mycoplasmopsis synoviae TaxID=2109 RepID=UPI001CE2223B|nr:hypothetical protein [Mycoplasmopsis synoviae]UBX98460.1 hypothetical protein K6987_02790 [Mycoplasmopsis synoviae]
MIKEIRKNSSEYGYDAKLAQKNITLELLKTTLNLNLKFINLKNLKKFLKIYNAKEMTVESTFEFIKRSYSIKCRQLKRFTIELIQKFQK